MHDLVKLLEKKNLTISSCESITGGAFSEALVKTEGASKVFRGGLIAYSAHSKVHLARVQLTTLQSFGAVSVETAIEMAQNAKNLFDSAMAISFTGNAGPEIHENKPLGLVYIALAYNNKCLVYEYQLSGNRKQIINKCVKLTKELIKENLK
ncbi:CinA family protein [Spiroplasma endosymbiont of Clivina fossor]|uniref:CinA family protein n=1 Tax=Spiroplasma endosymbiont of Clivina fossor TaxID=3066282 RepID=UPI00313C97CE